MESTNKVVGHYFIAKPGRQFTEARRDYLYVGVCLEDKGDLIVLQTVHTTQLFSFLIRESFKSTFFDITEVFQVSEGYNFNQKTVEELYLLYDNYMEGNNLL